MIVYAEYLQEEKARIQRLKTADSLTAIAHVESGRIGRGSVMPGLTWRIRSNYHQSDIILHVCILLLSL